MEIKPELKSYLLLKGWKYKPATPNDVAIQVCPFCGKNVWKFWIQINTTQYKCWHCGSTGNLYKLKRELGDLQGVKSATRLMGDEKKAQIKPIPMQYVDRYHQALLKSKKGMAYCKERGFTLDTIKHFKLGMQISQGKKWLAIPHIVDDVCYNIKFRSIPPASKTFRRVKGGASVLFNADALADFEEIVIAEAETDAIALWQAGVKNVIGLTCGADSFLPEWYDLLVGKQKIILVLDADVVGQKGSRDIARRLGFDRCYNVLLPGHDANDVLLNLGPQELVKALSRSEQFEVAGIIQAADAMLLCKDADEMGEQGLLTPWENVNRLVGKGSLPGDLVVLSARVKTGKTTFAMNWAHYLAFRHNIGSLVYCMEMRTRKLAEKEAALIRQRDVDLLTGVDYSLARYELRKIPFYFADPQWNKKSLTKEHIYDKIREAVKRYGIKFVIFDNLHFLCRSLQYITAEVGQVTRDFKMLAEELDIVMCLIAQPRKIPGDKPMKYDDIKDSSSVPADADLVIILHRNQIPAGLKKGSAVDSEQEVLESKTLVRIDASRFNSGGECYLHYEGSKAVFWEYAKAPGARLLRKPEPADLKK